MSSVEVGRVKIVDANEQVLEFATGGGTVEVLDNHILLLAESLESKEEIDVERAKDSLRRAKDRLSIANKKDVDSTRAEASLQRAINRLKLCGHYN